MADSTLAGVITAVATLATAVALVITAVGGLITARRIARKVDAVQVVTDENHKMLNQDRTDRLNYQAMLIKELRRAGVRVPDDQSNPTTHSS